MNKIILAWTLVVSLLAVVSCQSEHQQRICGSRLSNMLTIVCHGQFQSWSKKSLSTGLGNGDDLILPPLGDDYNERLSNWPWMQRHTAGSMTAGRRFKRQGVVDECCYKGCTINELRSYCDF